MWNKTIQNRRIIIHLHPLFYEEKMSKLVINAPKGLLRLVILDISSKNPISGTEVIRYIENQTNNKWKPSPGSVYLIIKNLLKQEYLVEIYSPESNHKKYASTSKGKSLMILEKGKLEESLTKNLYSIKIMADLLDMNDIELMNMMKSNLEDSVVK